MNPDIKMTGPMLNIEWDMPEYAQGWQQAFMDLYSDLPNELDPQLAFIVRNLAYQRALLVKQDQTIKVLLGIVGELMGVAGIDESAH